MPDFSDVKPLTDQERRQLDERDQNQLKSDLWGWYVFLYRDADNYQFGVNSDQPQGINPPNYNVTINWPGFSLPNPNLTFSKPGGGGSSPGQTDQPEDNLDELLDIITESAMGGGTVTVPPCYLAKKGKASDIPGIETLKQRVNNNQPVNVKWPKSALDQCSSILDGFTIEHCTYTYPGVLNGCETDGVRAVIRNRNGTTTTIGPFAYKDGPSQWKCWATKTLAEVMEELWEQLRAKIKQDCCW